MSKRGEHMIGKAVPRRSKESIEAEILENTKKLDPCQAQWAGSVPPRYRLEASRILTDSASSLRRRIKMKCMDCTGFEDSTTRVRDCTINICPLWHVRPFQKKAGKGQPGDDLEHNIDMEEMEDINDSDSAE